MNLWIVTNLRLSPHGAWRASAIQNLRTAAALADRGHSTLLWHAGMAGLSRDRIGRTLGRALPANLRFLEFQPRGESGQKKTPFASTWTQHLYRTMASLKVPEPRAIITRSPLMLEQLAAQKWKSPAPKLVLEYQYLEYHQLWRGWREKHASAPGAEALAQARTLRGEEARHLQFADGILYAAVGHERLLARWTPGRPARWLPSGCTINPTPPQMPAPAPGGGGRSGEKRCEVAYVGRISPENGLDTLLRAAVLLNNARIRVVGDGAKEYVAHLKSMAAELKVDSRVEFARPVAPGDVARIMRDCEIGVAPFSARCGPEKRQFASPLKVMEWLASGTPLVVSDVSSVRRMLNDGQNALLARPDDAQSLAATIALLLRDDTLKEHLSRSAVESAAEFSFERRAERIEQFIESL